MEVFVSKLRSFHIALFNIVSFFDPQPKFLEHETENEYLFRVDKKYALRRLTVYINAIPTLDLEEANQALTHRLPRGHRALIKLMKKMTIQRDLYILLKRQISES